MILKLIKINNRIYCEYLIIISIDFLFSDIDLILNLLILVYFI